MGFDSRGLSSTSDIDNWQPSEDDIAYYQAEYRRKREAEGLPQVDPETERDIAKQDAIDAYRSKYSSGLGAVPVVGGWLRNVIEGKPVMPSAVKAASRRATEAANAAKAEYEQPVDYAAPSISMDERDIRMRALAEQYARAAADVSAGVGATQADLDRRNRALAMAEEAAAGRAPSAAEIQGRQQLESALQSQLAMAARARGGNMSLALRSAGMNAANMQAQAAQNAAGLRAQEMAEARKLYSEGSANAARLGLDSSEARAKAMGLAAQYYGNEASDQVNTALKMRQANAGYVMESRAQRDAYKDALRRAKADAMAADLAARAQELQGDIATNPNLMKYLNAGAQIYAAYSSGSRGSTTTTPTSKGSDTSFGGGRSTITTSYPEK